MTKNRFTLEEFGLNFIVNDNGRNLTAKQTVDKLNQLYEEKEQLKEERDYFERKKCEYFNKYNKKHLDNIQLKKENEELENKIDALKDDKINGVEKWLTFDETVTILNQLDDENEQLKQFKEKVFSLLDEEIVRNEEAIEWGEEVDADCGSMGFYNHMLKRLKKELKE